MSKKIFTFIVKAYLKDTNMLGNVYFSRYFDWQGMAREEFFTKLIPEPDFFLKRSIKLITIEAQMKYFKEALLFDTIQIKVTPCNVKIATFELLFKFEKIDTNELIAEGKQRIGFTKDNEVISIPAELLRTGREYI